MYFHYGAYHWGMFVGSYTKEKYLMRQHAGRCLTTSKGVANSPDSATGASFTEPDWTACRSMGPEGLFKVFLRKKM